MSVGAAMRVGRRARSPRRGSRSAGSGRSRGARGARRRALIGAARRPGDVPARRRAPSWPPPCRGEHNAFKVELAQRAIVRALDDCPGRRSSDDHRDRTGAVDRVDGPLKVTGAARYSAEIALPGMTHAGDRRRASRRARGSPIDTERRGAGRRRARRPDHRDLPKIDASRTLLPSLFGARRAGRELLPDAGRRRALRRAAGRARRRGRPRAGATTRRRWSSVAYERAPSVTTIDQGRDARVRARAAVRRAHAGPRQRGDVDGALARATTRCGRLPLRRQPPQPDRGAGDDRGMGGRPAHALRLDDGRHARRS